jgi:hypothetical protein
MVTLFAKIVRERRGRVIATNEFSARVPAGKDTPVNGVVALQSGFDQGMKDLVPVGRLLGESAVRRLKVALRREVPICEGSDHLQSALIFG